MQIKSNFKDYYDCIQRFGQDDLKYIRHPIETKEICLGLKKQYTSIPKYSWKNVRILFCGKLYSGYKFTKGLNSTKFMYDPEEVEGFCNEHDIRYRSGSIWDISLHSDWEHLERANATNNYLPICEKYLTPIVVVASTTYDKIVQGKTINRWSELATINARLNQYDFQKVFGPVEAFMAIQTFLSNLAFPNKPIPNVSDEDMICAKGFDKYSFRKDKV